MIIDNKYNVGQTYYRYRDGIIEEVTITKLSCYIRPDNNPIYRYCGEYSTAGCSGSSSLMDVEERSLNLFESKEECRKYAITKLLEQ